MKTLDKILICASEITGASSIGYGIYNEDAENCIKYGVLLMLAGVTLSFLNIQGNIKKKNDS